MLALDYRAIGPLFKEVPEHPYMLHGDYHSNNVMLQNNEPLMIVADKSMVIGYTRLLRRTLRRNADTEMGQKCIAYYKSRLAELLNRVDTLVF